MLDNNTLLSNRYKIIGKIASGGMSDVFIAQDIKLDRKVAVKVLHETSASDRNLVIKFKREAQILAKLDHPNIVSVYDWGQYKDSYYICMEYVEGTTLKELIEKKGPLDVKNTCFYVLKICDALEAAHKNSLIHRDIKPQNILITKENDIKVTDFGIAKSLIDDVTKTLNILGTANYISPEQAKGNMLDSRTDIYSLGVLLYEMVTADLPFRGETTIDVTLKHLHEKPVRPSKLVEGFPSPLEKIILKCMEKDPGDRYQSVATLKKDLIGFLEGRKILAGSNLDKAKRDYRMDSRKPFRIKLILYILAGILVLTTVAFLMLFLSYFYRYKALARDIGYVKVPPIEMIDAAAAENILNSYGLELNISDIVERGDLQDGIVVKQSVAPGDLLEKGSRVDVIIAANTQEVEYITVPDLTGKFISEATKIISDIGLNLGEISQNNDDNAPAGTVLSQDPGPGEDLEQGQTIDIVISEGTVNVTIPNIIGWDYYLASSHLRELGLEVTYNKRTELQSPPGTILDVSPAIGQVVEKGELVTLFISTTEQLSIVPDLLYSDISEAINVLENSALTYEINYIDSDYSFQENTVIAQIPEAGHSIENGSSIILFVGD